MDNVILDPHGESLLRQYRELRPALEQLAKQAYDLLRHALREQGIYVTAIEYRVKTEKSLAGKLELKGAKYKSIDDITDLVGLRVITFYTDEVDKVAAIAKRIFDIDWQQSVDKRKLHQLDAFGYNSLHYICRLKGGSLPRLGEASGTPPPVLRKAKRQSRAGGGWGEADQAVRVTHYP